MADTKRSWNPFLWRTPKSGLSTIQTACQQVMEQSKCNDLRANAARLSQEQDETRAAEGLLGSLYSNPEYRHVVDQLEEVVTQLRQQIRDRINGEPEATERLEHAKEVVPLKP